MVKSVDTSVTTQTSFQLAAQAGALYEGLVGTLLTTHV